MRRWRCDGIVDCVRAGDAADEADCEVECGAGEFRCGTDGACIQDRWGLCSSRVVNEALRKFTHRLGLLLVGLGAFTIMNLCYTKWAF